MGLPAIKKAGVSAGTISLQKFPSCFCSMYCTEYYGYVVWLTDTNYYNRDVNTESFVLGLQNADGTQTVVELK